MHVDPAKSALTVKKKNALVCTGESMFKRQWTAISNENYEAFSRQNRQKKQTSIEIMKSIPIYLKVINGDFA